ncbi:MAG: NlpC/P60 family protein, partial [Ilumatobacter fluminis]
LAAYREVGINLTHWSAAQANQGVRVDLDTDGIRAGDLVFQQRNGSLVINHVGIAIDGQRWVHAVGTGKGVRISALPDASTITTVRRYIDG